MMSRIIRLLFVLTLVLGVAAIVSPAANAGGSGQCAVTGLKVKGNGSTKKPCKYMIPHGGSSHYGRRTDLQAKCARFYTAQRYSLIICWRNLVSNRYVTGGFGWSGDSSSVFSTELTLARCLTPRGANTRCPYMHVKLRNLDGRSSRTVTIKCGKGTGRACASYGVAAHDPDPYTGVSPDYYASSKIWKVEGKYLQDSTGCRVHLGGIQYASALINGRWARTTGASQSVRYTAHWKACDRTT